MARGLPPPGYFVNREFAKSVSKREFAIEIMSSKLKSPRQENRLGVTAIACGLALCLFARAAGAQEPPRHFLHAGVLAPGATAATKLMRGGPIPGYFQPVEITGPKGAMVSFVGEGQFLPPTAMPSKSAMLIGPVYRMRITGIPLHEGEEVYPSIEVVDRLYPPVGEELKFPIPIELTQEDLELALAGKFITRVVYLEDPRAAYPRKEDPKRQYTTEVTQREDPLVTADHMGRPMAIVRIGGRTPADASNPGADFLYNCPPLLRIENAKNAPRSMDR
jgi:hypothetical protein